MLVDADRISQVLTNALKYSSTEKPITVGVTLQEQQARVWVRDQGSGLTPREQQAVWQPYYQRQETMQQGDPAMGMGLGLSISQRLIQAHEGTCGVESIPGEGATFWFHLPWDRGK